VAFRLAALSGGKSSGRAGPIDRMVGQMQSRRMIRGAAAALAALVAGGCDSSTGVLIEVTRDDSVPADIGRLAFHVGIDGVIPDQPSRWVDPDPQEDIRLDGRDIAEDPYRLLIRPRQHPQAEVMVAVVAYSGGDAVGFGALAGPVRFVDGEVAMWPIVLAGELPGGFRDTDTGCLTWTDEGGDLVTIGRPRDQDCDGFADDDCNDVDPAVNPGSNERCGNAVDEDCDGQVDEDVDEDGDRVTTCGGDCNDHDSAVAPGAEEACDGVDNNCDGLCDEGQDADSDSYTVCGSKIVDGGATCLFDPERAADCDDFDEHVHPGAEEVCDGVDNDCNSVCDDAAAGLDRDGDGFTVCGSIVDHCGLADVQRDCNDRNIEVHPGAPELCDGFDDDCDGERLQVAPCFLVDDMDPTICVAGERACLEGDGEPGDWDGLCGRGGENTEVPIELCTAYDSCDLDIETHADPYTCSIETSGLVVSGCLVNVQFDSAELCPAAEVVLPTIGLGDPPVCSWAIVGGQDQGDYSVGLRDLLDPGGTPGGTLGVCGGALVVTTRGGLPGPQDVLLARTDELGATVFFAVSLDPALVEDCDNDRGLVCEDLPPPP
jgi:hypothetical protein